MLTLLTERYLLYYISGKISIDLLGYQRVTSKTSQQGMERMETQYKSLYKPTEQRLGYYPHNSLERVRTLPRGLTAQTTQELPCYA